MKAVSIIATAAGLIGSVAASAGHAHAHERLHQRQDWGSDPYTTTTTTTTTTASSTTSSTWGWGAWTTTSTTTAKAKAATTSSSSSTTWASGWPTWSSAVSVQPVSTCKAIETVTVTSSVKTITVTTTAAANATGWSYDPATTASTCSAKVVVVTGSATWVPDAPVSSSSSTWGWSSTETIYPVPWTTTSTTSSAKKTTTTTTSTTTTPSAVGWGAWTTTSSVAPVAATPTSSPAASSAWPASPSGGSGKAAISPNGNTWAITYSPYTASGGCKDAGSVASDIAAIAEKGFTTVRVYSTDCSTLQNVGAAARSHSMKMILGVFISSTGVSGAHQQVSDIVAWAQWDIVELIVVGNEAIFNGYCSAGELAAFIASVKGSASGAGYTGPVTTTEPLNIWQAQGSAFCSVVDVVAANLYAFFNPATTAEKAGSFIQSEISVLDSVCPGKASYVMETGWPHAGECNGAACPGSSEQATAIAGIKNTVGAKVVFFSFEDDVWKAPGEFNVEQSWGCAGVF